MSPLTFYCRACLVDFIFDDKSISSMTARYHSGRREELLAETRQLLLEMSDELGFLLAQTSLTTKGIGAMLAGAGTALPMALEDLIERQGLKVFLLARFLVGVRAPVYLAAGAMRVRFAKFLLVDLFCATSVVGVFFWLSYSFGASMGPFLRESQWALTGVVALIALLGGIYFVIVRRYRRKLNLDNTASKDD